MSYLLALIIGILTATIVNWGFSVAKGSGLIFSGEWGVLIFQILQVAAPFALLSLVGVRAKFPWIVGIILTAIFWAAYFVAGVTSWGGRDANIGLGLIMLISPLIIAAGAFLAARGKRRV